METSIEERLSKLEGIVVDLKSQVSFLCDLTKKVDNLKSVSYLEHIFFDFGLNFEKMNVFLKKYNGMIYGGSALYAFCQLDGEFDGDIDVWVQTKPFYGQSFPHGEKTDLDKIYKDFCDILSSFQLKKLDDPLPSYGKQDFFYKMYEFKLINGKKVKLFLTYLDNCGILSFYDLSCCATSWNGREFYSLDPGSTKNVITYRINEQECQSEES